MLLSQKQEVRVKKHEESWKKENLCYLSQLTLTLFTQLVQYM